MTVIAWDGRYVAADSLCTFEGYRGQKKVNKIVERNGVVYGITGYAAWLEAWIDWHEKGADPTSTPVCSLPHDGNFLVFKDGRGFSCVPALPYLQEVGAPDAWGSGAGYAIGAMKSGADAKRAVEVAIECCPGLGGPVDVLDLLACKHDWHGLLRPEGGYIRMCRKCEAREIAVA